MKLGHVALAVTLVGCVTSAARTSPTTAVAQVAQTASPCRSDADRIPAEEVAEFAAIVHAISQHRPALALELLRRHDACFPQGQFKEETAAMRVLALCEGGFVGEALVSDRAFRASYPSSLYARRIARSCAER